MFGYVLIFLGIVCYNLDLCRTVWDFRKTLVTKVPIFSLYYN